MVNIYYFFQLRLLQNLEVIPFGYFTDVKSLERIKSTFINSFKVDVLFIAKYGSWRLLLYVHHLKNGYISNILML